MEYCTGSTSSAAKRIKLFSGPGTRQWPRFDLSEFPAIQGISLESGSRIKVVNLSRGGALLQTRKPIARGTELMLLFGLAEGTVQIAGLVLRSSVSYLKGIPQYHAAVAFDRPLKICDELPGPAAEAFPSPVFKSAPPVLCSPARRAASHALIQEGDSAMIAAFFAISFYDAPDAGPDEMSSLNDW